MIPLLQRPPDVTKHPHAWTATRIRAYSAQELEVRPSSKGRTSHPPDARSPPSGARPSGRGTTYSAGPGGHLPLAPGFSRPGEHVGPGPSRTMIPLLQRPANVTRHPHAWTATRTRAHSAQAVNQPPAINTTKMEPGPNLSKPNILPPGVRPFSPPAGGSSNVTCN
jgi:hypothetical protein